MIISRYLCWCADNRLSSTLKRVDDRGRTAFITVCHMQGQLCVGAGRQLPPPPTSALPPLHGTLFDERKASACKRKKERSVLWSLKYAKMRFLPGLRPWPRYWELMTFPRPLIRRERGHQRCRVGWDMGRGIPPHISPFFALAPPFVRFWRLSLGVSPPNIIFQNWAWFAHWFTTDL